MPWIDIIIVTIVLISAGVSLFRGFVKEAISMLTWVAAIWLAINFSDQIAQWLPQSWESVSFNLGDTDFDISNMRKGVAFIIVLAGTLIVGAIINLILSRVTHNSILRGTDRTLGVLFGLARGAIVVTILVLVAGLTSVPDSIEWKQARLLDPFYRAAIWTLNVMPERYSRYFSY